MSPASLIVQRNEGMPLLGETPSVPPGDMLRKGAKPRPKASRYL
jgi:hypothetical protein